MRTLELLAPAKNLECGKAAVDHGADAVYIGPPRFGARAAAGNSVEDIRQLCHYAHRYGAKVYATVNTLLYDNELAEARQLLAQLGEAGVDAVLVQDVSLFTPLPADGCHPVVFNASLKYHASTQADNRTAERVRQLYNMGFRRAVLARELTVSEVAVIHAAVPQMELEVFVHGALCVSYSGLCYASEYCFNRSANRGECAQFCRMAFDLIDAEGRELEHQRHLLSLKDLNLSRHLDQLIEAGASSFKIEGRLKDVSYVKNVTAAYSELLNSYVDRHPDKYRRASEGRCKYTFQPDLSRTFNRGYTTYFIQGRQPGLASFDTPKAIGQMVGTVKELRGTSFTVAGTRPLATFANGDGLCFFDSQRQLHGFRVNRVEGNRLFPQSMPENLLPDTPLFRSNDQAMERVLSKTSAERKIPLHLSLKPYIDEDGQTGFMLTVLPLTSTRQHNSPEGENLVEELTVRCQAEHQLARTPQQTTIRRELSKFGGTPYEAEIVELPDDFPYFIPASLLSSLRRKAIESLEGRVEHAESLCPATFMRSELERATEGIAVANSTPELSRRPLMQCRYCLRYELGYCVKHGGRKPMWHEPLSLRLGDGRCFRLEFDCQHCQMNVYAASGLNDK